MTQSESHSTFSADTDVNYWRVWTGPIEGGQPAHETLVWDIERRLRATVDHEDAAQAIRAHRRTVCKLLFRDPCLIIVALYGMGAAGVLHHFTGGIPKVLGIMLATAIIAMPFVLISRQRIA